LQFGFRYRVDVPRKRKAPFGFFARWLSVADESVAASGDRAASFL